MSDIDIVYNSFKGAQWGKNGGPGPIDFDTDPIYAMLVTNTYTNLADATRKAHVYRSDLSGEAAGTGYTAGGVLLTGVTLTQSGDSFIFSANAPQWPGATLTAHAVVLYKRVGADLTTPADDPLIAQLTFGQDVGSTNAVFIGQWNAAGIFQES